MSDSNISSYHIEITTATSISFLENVQLRELSLVLLKLMGLIELPAYYCTIHVYFSHVSVLTWTKIRLIRINLYRQRNRVYNLVELQVNLPLQLQQPRRIKLQKPKFDTSLVRQFTANFCLSGDNALWISLRILPPAFIQNTTKFGDKQLCCCWKYLQIDYWSYFMQIELTWALEQMSNYGFMIVQRHFRLTTSHLSIFFRNFPLNCYYICHENMLQ